jgi:hypothetical protein
MLGFRSRKDEFFAMFDQAARNVHEGAKVMLDLMEHYEDMPNKVRRLKEIEHAGDEMTHRILERLAKTFITPLDREDIHLVATRLDDVLDGMDTATNRIVLFGIGQVTDDARGLGRVLLKATGLLTDAFGLLHNLKHPAAIMSLCVEIHTQENEGDRLVHLAMANLFENEDDAKEIIKWKDIYEILERSIDRCEDVADVLHTIVVKNA